MPSGDVPHAARHLVPLPPVQQSARSLLLRAAPLFEEEGDAAVGALAPNGPDPRGLHRSGPGAALASDDDPVKPIERECLDGPQQGLRRAVPSSRWTEGEGREARGEDRSPARTDGRRCRETARRISPRSSSCIRGRSWCNPASGSRSRQSIRWGYGRSLLPTQRGDGKSYT